MAFPSGGFILKVVVVGGEFMVWKSAAGGDGVAPGSWFMWNGCWVSSDGRSMEASFLSLVRWGISFHDGMKEHHLVVGVVALRWRGWLGDCNFFDCWCQAIYEYRVRCFVQCAVLLRGWIPLCMRCSYPCLPPAVLCINISVEVVLGERPATLPSVLKKVSLQDFLKPVSWYILGGLFSRRGSTAST